MARIDQYSRILHHRLTAPGALFTIPSSSDHTDETWAATDLYIGELGINVTDDKIFMRTNNGIVQLATATASSAGSNVWIYSGTEVQIGSSFSAATAITKAATGTQSVSLGTTSKRFSDLFFGDSGKGSLNTLSSIDIRNNAGQRFLTAGFDLTTEDSAIHIGLRSNPTARFQGLYLNSGGATMSNGGYNRVVLGGENVILDDAEYCVSINATNVQIGDSSLGTVADITHIGPGYAKKNLVPQRTTVGGSFAVRSLDNGTNGGNSQPIYAESDWITAQAKLDTINALSTSIVSIPWTSGDAIQMKAYVMGVNRDDGTVYSAEISASGINLGAGFVQLTGDPYILEQSTFGSTYSIAPNDIAEATIECDLNYFYVKVKGHSASEVNWICTYNYHRMKNLFS